MSIIKRFHYRAKILTIIGLFTLNSSCIDNGKRAQDEVKIVERIGAEVALYKFHFKYGATRMNEVITAAEELLEAVRNPENELTEEQVELKIHKLTLLWLAATPTTEYNTLARSGEISLVTSERLRRKFKEMNNDQEKLLQFEELQINYMNNQLRPFLNQRIDRTIYYSSQNYNATEPVRSPSPFSNSAKDLLEDQEFANLLVDVLFFTERVMLPYNRLNTLMADIEKIIKEDYPTVSIEPYGPQ